MDKREISGRTVLQGGAALAGLVALGLPLEELEVEAANGEEVIPWLDQPLPNPVPEIIGTQLVWEELGSSLTWTHTFFTVQHYGPWPAIREPGWQLAGDGLVQRPLALTLAELHKRPRRELIFTLECSITGQLQRACHVPHHGQQP